MNVDIGIEEDGRKELADTSTLYLKTHGYHWNVVGPMFHSLHLMFEQQYLELRDAVDVIAERIRALGSLAPGSYAELARLSSVADEEGARTRGNGQATGGRAPAARAHGPPDRREAGAGQGRHHRGPRERADQGAREDRLNAAERSRIVGFVHAAEDSYL
jgi:Ferritin-like domain